MTPKHCSNCGTEQAPDAKFCKKCGTSFEAKTTTVPSSTDIDNKTKPSTAKKAGGGVLGVIAFLIGWAIVRAAINGVNSNTVENATWNTAAIGGNKAVIDMPCTPTSKTENTTTNGFNISTISYSCTYTKVLFDVFYTHYPENADTSDQHAILDASVSGAAETAKGRVTKKEFKTIAGKNAVDYTLEAPNNETVYARNIISGNDLYIIGYEPQDSADTQYFDRMVNSFKIN